MVQEAHAYLYIYILLGAQTYYMDTYYTVFIKWLYCTGSSSLLYMYFVQEAKSYYVFISYSKHSLIIQLYIIQIYHIECSFLLYGYLITVISYRRLRLIIQLSVIQL